jgi:hypothetical protein
MCSFSLLDFPFFILTFALTMYIILFWQGYSTCHAPVQIPLLLLNTLYLTHRLSSWISEFSTGIPFVRRFSFFFRYIIIQPGIIVSTLLCIEFYQENMEQTPECSDNVIPNWIFPLFFALLLMADLALVLLTFF